MTDASIKQKLASICSAPGAPTNMPSLAAAPTLTPTPAAPGNNSMLYAVVGLVVGVVGVLIAVKLWEYMKAPAAPEPAPAPAVNADDFFNGIARSLIQQRQQAPPQAAVEPVAPVPDYPVQPVAPVPAAPQPTQPAAPPRAPPEGRLSPRGAPPPAQPAHDPLADDPNFTPL